MPDLNPRTGLLRRLRHDVSGNVMAIMAASLFPLIAGVGAAVDISRNYMAKSRLQQACDAGVLAGRKAQPSQIYTAEARTQANRFFSFNYPAGLYGSENVSFASNSNVPNEVSGSASVFVPSTITKVIGYSGAQLTVDCSARLDLANTDIMFVLDVSGSMNCPSDSAAVCDNGDNKGVEFGGGDTTASRIGALRQAVRDFHSVLETARRADTQIRYGFMSYSSAVNVGALLRTENINLIDSRHDYQTREWVATPTTFQSNQATCTFQKGTWTSGNGGRCAVQGFYRHSRRTLDVNSYRQGNIIVNPANRNGGNLQWSGCIEERDTVAQTNFSPIPAGAFDLDPDTGVGDGSDNFQWRPMLDATYIRNFGTVNENFAEGTSDSTIRRSSCPPGQAQLVTTQTAKQIDDRVKTLKPIGGTYHDLGMIWGLRLLSPDGIWKARNTQSPLGLPIVRHIVFMTDGQMKPNDGAYSAYGLERHDERVAGGIHAPAGATEEVELTARHNARFLAICNLARGKNIRVWAVALGTRLNDTQLATCADTGRSFEAQNSQQLNDTFRRIATRIADLRLTR